METTADGIMRSSTAPRARAALCRACAAVFLFAAPLLALDEVLWEKNSAWAPADTTYFDGAVCALDGADACPREMGWQGNRLAWRFALPADAAKTPELRLELIVDRFFNAVTIEVLAGPEGAQGAAVGSLAVQATGIYRLRIPASAFRAGGLNEIALRGDCEVGYGKPSGIRWAVVGLYRHYDAPPAVTDRELLDDTQWRACRYFFEQAFGNGLVLDTQGAGAASMAAVGFGATAMTILAERAGTTPRWTISRDRARARAEAILDAVLAIQSRQAESAEEWGFAGIPYHFVDAEGRRARSSEVSTIDAAIMLAGLLQAGEYFGGELRTKADAVFRAVDFKRFYRAEHRRYSHGWRPESGFIATEWDRPGDETLLVCLLALAQDPADPDRLKACYGYVRVSEAYAGIPVVRSYFGSLFTYTFAHFWFPFECLGKDRPGDAGMGTVAAVDWWQNSRRAVEASRRYHADLAATYPALGARAWGASACYRADRAEYFGTNGAAPAEAEPAFDGTLPPHGAVMALFLARTAADETLGANPAFQALRYYYESRFAALWCSYGPRSSFDNAGNVSPMVVCIEKGPEALGIEAYLSGMPARTLSRNAAIAAALARVFERAACPQPFIRGRVNADRATDIADPIFVLTYLFGRGQPPACRKAADANGDGAIDIADAIVLLALLFGGLAALPAPFAACGLDAGTNDLSCDEFPECTD